MNILCFAGLHKWNYDNRSERDCRRCERRELFLGLRWHAVPDKYWNDGTTGSGQ